MDILAPGRIWEKSINTRCWCLGMPHGMFTLSLWSFTIKHNGWFNGTVVREHEEMACVLRAQSRGIRTWSLQALRAEAGSLAVMPRASREPPLPSALHSVWLPASPGLVWLGERTVWKLDACLSLGTIFLSPQTPLNKATNTIFRRLHSPQVLPCWRGECVLQDVDIKVPSGTGDRIMTGLGHLLERKESIQGLCRLSLLWPSSLPTKGFIRRRAPGRNGPGWFAPGTRAAAGLSLHRATAGGVCCGSHSRRSRAGQFIRRERHRGPPPPLTPCYTQCRWKNQGLVQRPGP